VRVLDGEQGPRRGTGFGQRGRDPFRFGELVDVRAGHLVTDDPAVRDRP
jgi:hypothetical protein